MKKSKKFLATILTGAVALTAIAGLTACGGNNSGEGVTAEAWANAFENTINAENYTVNSNVEMSTLSKGNVNGQEISSGFVLSGTSAFYYDLTGKKSYEEGKITEKMTGEGLPEEMLGEEITEAKTYSAIESKTLWVCEFDYENNEWDAASNVFASEEEAKTYFSSTDLGSALSVKQYYAAVPVEGAAKSLSELYSAFTYTNGQYTATLYAQAMSDYAEIKITVRINDGYVTFMQAESGGEATEDNVTVTSSSKSSFTVSNIGSTQVPQPEEALKAIEAEKTA